MIRSIRVLGAISWHYVSLTARRNKYSVEDKEYDKEKKKLYRKEVFLMMKELSNRMIKAADTEVIVQGKENLPKEGPVLYMATHKGQYDSFVLASLLEDTPIFIGKEEMKKMPIFSKWFNAMGCIYLARDDMKQSMQAILEGIKELQGGQSIVIYPEGTRSKSTEMGEFKAGSFKLATKSKVPIVPIAIQNTHKVLEETGRIQKATVYVNIGKPIETKDLSSQEQKELPKKVQAYVEELLKEVTH